MRPLLVVVGQPGVSDRLDLAQRVEQVGVEYLLPEAPVKPLDECVLVGLARLDVQQCDTTLFGPIDKRIGREFRAIVQADRIGTAVNLNQFRHHSHNPG